jgi:putative flippase GtrA
VLQRERLRHLRHELAAFGAVGAMNFVLDVAVFNVLRLTVLSDKPLTSKGISFAVAATSSYFLNRHWTWRHRARSGLSRELPLFLLLSGVGLLVTEGCLATSHYLLGLRSVAADNVAANGVGLLLGLGWRFWAFRRWVFLAPTGQREPTPLEDAVRTTV